MKNKKAYKELVLQMEALNELQLGKLKGGFSAYTSTNSASYRSRSNSVSVSVSGDPCSCSCSCEGTQPILG